MFSIEGAEPAYLSFFIKSELFKSQVRSLETSGTAQKRLHERQFLELELPLPSAKEQKEIISRCKYAEKINNQVAEEIVSQQTYLQQLRQAILQEAGMSFDNVVKTTIFLTDMNRFGDVNEIYGKYFNGDFPARETVQVSALPKFVNVEMSMIAVK